MRIVMFYHSLISDWNHGNAHFLRGMVSEFQARGHEVVVYEPRNGWSLSNLRQHYGEDAVRDFREAFPHLQSVLYDAGTLDLERALDEADLTIVHEWNDHGLVHRIGEHKTAVKHPMVLLFHDTHHRSMTDPATMARYDLAHYDGVLAFGDVIRDIYLARQWTRRAWTWHEAADVRFYRPIPSISKAGDLIWIGNWGDEERSAELREFLIEPVKALKLKAKVHGTRYPQQACDALANAEIEFGGWLPAASVPLAYASHRATVHVPRRPYVESLPGIPTIRVFEALACGIPLVCSPWNDAEHLFTPGKDFLVAHNGAEMTNQLNFILSNPDAAAALAQHGRNTILARHTCAHRADELLHIVNDIRQSRRSAAGRARPVRQVNGSAKSATPRSPTRNRIAFFGSSLISAYWNGAATYYRGIIRGLHALGYHVTFYEPAAFDRQKHRDIADPHWANVVVYPTHAESDIVAALRNAVAEADILVKASGVGVFDSLLESHILRLKKQDQLAIFWDVDAPATLDRVLSAGSSDPFRALIPRFDLICTYGGGEPVVNAYQSLGAKQCVPIYNALDETTHFPVPPDPARACDLLFLGNRLPDREARVEEFFLKPAKALHDRTFLIGGNGWDDKPMPSNVRRLGHVYTHEHNVLNCSARAILNISRQSMARFGFSPATRVFEAAGAGACIITDAWEGIEMFLEPSREILVAENGGDVQRICETLSATRVRQIGLAARERVLAEHTYTHRALLVHALLLAQWKRRKVAATQESARASRPAAQEHSLQ